MPEGVGPPYRVVYSEAVRNALKALCERAARGSRGEEILSAVRTIDEQLRSDPLGFGDPWHDLPAARLTVMIRVFPPLVVSYAVHKEKPVVFVKHFRPFPPDAF